MKIKCDISKIKATDSLVIMAVYDLFKLQSHTCVLEAINKDEYVFLMKSNLPPQSQQRLFADKIPEVLYGYQGKVVEGKLYVNK